MVLSATAMVSLPVFADETSDTQLPTTKIGFSFTQAANTGFRPKTNTTSHYIKNTSGFNLWVRSMNSGGTNLTVNDHAIVPVAERFIRNLVYEKGNRNCKLNVTTAVSGTTGTLRGLWSPDSVGSYPNAN